MKGHSNIRPEQVFRFSDHSPLVQIRWNIIRNDYLNEEGIEVESYHYDYLDVDTSNKEDMIKRLTEAGCDNVDEILTLI